VPVASRGVDSGDHANVDVRWISFSFMPGDGGGRARTIWEVTTWPGGRVYIHGFHVTVIMKSQSDTTTSVHNSSSI
jgi:hypothetical protein